ncbi:MAG: hypothetical protein GY892_10395 [Shimia sp.]|nr:hypothetical protein [Shimia sp.]
MNQLIFPTNECAFTSIYSNLGCEFPKRRNREFESPNREYARTDQGSQKLEQGSGVWGETKKPLLGLPVHWQFASGDGF